jgi:hypothetical protein
MEDTVSDRLVTVTGNNGIRLLPSKRQAHVHFNIFFRDLLTVFKEAEIAYLKALFLS